jgi:voltage-gated potassium channel Kch
VVAVGSAASLLQGTVSTAVKRGLLTDELVRRMAKDMQNHVIVVGYKFLGKYVVENLQTLNVDFMVIAKDESQLDILRSNKIPSLYSPVTRVYETLKDANVEKASILVSTLDSDGDNMLTVLAGKKLNQNIKNISIVNDRELIEGMRNAGADVVIPYLEIVGQMLSLSSLSEEQAGILLTDNVRLRHIAEFKIMISGITYGDIKETSPVLMVSRNGEFKYNIRDDFKLKEGDTIYVLVNRESIGAFRDKLKSLNAAASKKSTKP